MTSTELRLVLDGREQTLSPGAMALGREELVYRDAPDKLLRLIESEIRGGQPWRDVAARHLGSNPWLLRVVADPARQLWLDRHSPAAGSTVLEGGAGWGQWAVPAAKTARVVALEPNPARLAVIQAVAEQEHCAANMFFVGAAVEHVDFPAQTFDQVYCIGVLEWVPKFAPDADPIDAQRGFLRRMRELLAPGGECVIGIENRLGLKYLLGARDDHTGQSGISCLDAATAARLHLAKTGQPLRVFTHTLAEYEELLRAAGFAHAEFFAAFPDYKVPQVIVPLADGAANRHCLGGAMIPEHHGNDGAPVAFADQLASHYRSLATLGTAGLFAPSFFIRARG
jgi:SAM-dependent methyltransferase